MGRGGGGFQHRLMSSTSHICGTCRDLVFCMAPVLLRDVEHVKPSFCYLLINGSNLRMYLKTLMLIYHYNTFFLYLG